MSFSMLSLSPCHKVCLPFGSNLSPLSKHVDKMDLSDKDNEANSSLQSHEIYVCTQFNYRNCDDIDHNWATNYPCHWKQELKEHQQCLQTALPNLCWTNKALNNFIFAFDRNMTKWDLTTIDDQLNFPKILEKLTKIQNYSNCTVWSHGTHFMILGPHANVNDATCKCNLLNIVNLQPIAKNQFPTVQEIAKCK